MLLSRIAGVARLVIPRQTFDRRCHPVRRSTQSGTAPARQRADAVPSVICTSGVPRAQTLVGRFALGAGSVALSQTFDLGGQTVVLVGQTRGCVNEPAWGRFQRELWARCLVPECRGISQADPAFREGLWARGCTTTHAVRTAIQRSKAPLGLRRGSNHKTAGA